MIEYTVILVALTTTLYSVTQGPSTTTVIGTDKDQDNSLMQGIHRRYSEQSFGLRITDLPEYSNIDDIKGYYENLGKYPELSKKLGSAAASINQVTAGLDTLNNHIEQLASYKERLKNIDQELEGYIKEAVDDMTDIGF
ncbi:MAG: hypothetical protein MJK10_04755 [Pseudomonadales bacterium]|nr:hypothetical protein [Pseudomonadales bacterium]NRA15011.1 hypothetical protein [Oceanospirillaceae bacterium]